MKTTLNLVTDLLTSGKVQPNDLRLDFARRLNAYVDQYSSWDNANKDTILHGATHLFNERVLQEGMPVNDNPLIRNAYYNTMNEVRAGYYGESPEIQYDRQTMAKGREMFNII